MVNKVAISLSNSEVFSYFFRLGYFREGGPATLKPKHDPATRFHLFAIYSSGPLKWSGNCVTLNAKNGRVP